MPDPPRFDLWPEALRSAERIRGTLVPCGPGLRGVGWPETPRIRLTSIGPWLCHNRVATHLTAAWVWGAARAPGTPLRVSTASRARHAQQPTEALRVHELRLGASDITYFGPFAVTTPLRTISDLLHDTQDYALTERIAVRLLCRLVHGGDRSVLDHLATHRRPQRLAAYERYRRDFTWHTSVPE